jgi:hypothetical protein
MTPRAPASRPNPAKPKQKAIRIRKKREQLKIGPSRRKGRILATPARPPVRRRWPAASEAPFSEIVFFPCPGKD